MVMFRPRTELVSLSLLRLLMIGCVGASVIMAPCDVAAQGPSPSGRTRQARVSRDLEQRLATGNVRNETIILTGSAARIARVAGRHGLQVRKWLETGAVLDVPAGSLRDIADDGEVDQLSTNQVLRSQMAVTNETIGADLVVSGEWSRRGSAHPGRGYDGTGVGVALIDSGVAVMPQLGNRVVARFDFTEARGQGLDAYGHGTHVAGIIAAAGTRRRGNAPGGVTAGGAPGNITGVAPGAHIVSLKVLDAEGAGTADNVIEAIDFAIKVRKRFNIKVINLSLGGAVLQPAADDPI